MTVAATSVQHIVHDSLTVSSELLRVHYGAQQLATAIDAQSTLVWLARGLGQDTPIAILQQAASGGTPETHPHVRALRHADLTQDPFFRGLSSLVSQRFANSTEPMPTIAVRRVDLCPDISWRAHPFVRAHFLPANIGYTVASVTRLSGAENVYLVVMINRDWNRVHFTPDQAQQLDEFARSITPSVAMTLTPSVSGNPDDAPAHRLARLSAAERRVLPLLLSDLTKEEIARQLHRSRNTVHSHARNIYAALGVSSRVELVARYGAEIMVRPHYNHHAAHAATLNG